MPWETLWNSTNFNLQQIWLHYQNPSGKIVPFPKQNLTLRSNQIPSVSTPILYLKIPPAQSESEVIRFIFPIASIFFNLHHQEILFWMKANLESEAKPTANPYLFLELSSKNYAAAIPVVQKNQWELKVMDLSLSTSISQIPTLINLVILPRAEDLVLEFGSFNIGHYTMEQDIHEAFQKTGEQVKSELKDLRIEVLQDYWLREKSPEFSLDTYKIIFHTILLQVQPSRQRWESEQDSFIYQPSFQNGLNKYNLIQIGERPPDIPYDIYTNVYVVSPKEKTQAPRQQNRIRESLLKIFSSPWLWVANRKVPISIATGVTEKECFHETWGIPFLRLKISAWDYGGPRKYYSLNSLVSLKDVEDNAENKNEFSILFEKEKP